MAPNSNFWKRLRMENCTSKEYLDRPKRYERQDYDPQDIFHDTMRNCDAFTCLKGYSEDITRMAQDGRYYASIIKTNMRVNPSCAYVYNDKKGDCGAIIVAPKQRHWANLMHLQCLWVPDRCSGQGIGRDTVEEFKWIVESVDDICRAGKGYKEKLVSYKRFGAILCPNPFTFTYPDDFPEDKKWGIDQSVCDIDWTDPEDRDLHMIDGRVKDLPEDISRVRWEQLRDFYHSCGFRDDDSYDESEYYDDGSLRGWPGIRTKYNLSKHSMDIGRHMMTWFPEKSDDTEKKGP